MDKELNKKDEEKPVLDADELLSSEVEEVEGGAECGCTSCQYVCYSEVW
ncbi:hypothetical protein [uncultured Bacteroides sp.]|nr:hypothetical protein [uncultured Bacteroides sp.]